MSKKILNIATFGLAGSILKPFGHSKPAPNPAVLNDNETLISPTATQKPRRGAPIPLGQSQTGGTILTDTLGG